MSKRGSSISLCWRNKCIANFKDFVSAVFRSVQDRTILYFMIVLPYISECLHNLFFHCTIFPCSKAVRLYQLTLPHPYKSVCSAISVGGVVFFAPAFGDCNRYRNYFLPSIRIFASFTVITCALLIGQSSIHSSYAAMILSTIF